MLKAPGATASTRGYYWSIFKRDPAEARAAAATQVTMPALMITGDESLVTRALYEKARAAFTSDYRYVEVAGVGHFPQLEAPDQVAQAILGFLQPRAAAQAR